MDNYNKIADGEERKRSGRSYPLAKHHAWGGLALLSLLGLARILFPELPDLLWIPVASLLAVYILIWLFMTYRYRKELAGGSPAAPPPVLREEKIRKESVKNRAKMEKKLAKARIKAEKKEG